MDTRLVLTESEQIGAFVMRFGLSRSQAVILAALYRANGRVVSDDRLRSALYPLNADEPETNVIKVFIYQLRERFGRQDVVLAPGCGYALSAGGIARARRALEEKAA